VRSDFPSGLRPWLSTFFQQPPLVRTVSASYPFSIQAPLFNLFPGEFSLVPGPHFLSGEAKFHFHSLCLGGLLALPNSSAPFSPSLPSHRAPGIPADTIAETFSKAFFFRPNLKTHHLAPVPPPNPLRSGAVCSLLRHPTPPPPTSSPNSPTVSNLPRRDFSNRIPDVPRTLPRRPRHSPDGDPLNRITPCIPQQRTIWHSGLPPNYVPQKFFTIFSLPIPFSNRNFPDLHQRLKDFP